MDVSIASPCGQFGTSRSKYCGGFCLAFSGYAVRPPTISRPALLNWTSPLSSFRACGSSLRRPLTQFTEHYHAERNHQGKSNLLLFPSAEPRTS